MTKSITVSKYSHHRCSFSASSSSTEAAASSRLAAVASNTNDGDGDDDNRSILDEQFRSSSSLLLDRRSVVLGSFATAASAALVVSSEPVNAMPMRIATTTTANLSSMTQQDALSKIPSWTLPGNVQFPRLALNTVGLSTDDTVRALEIATKYEMTHVDFHPGKERDGVAQFLAENNPGNTDRKSKLFLNTKIRKAPPGTSPADAADLVRTQIKEDLAVLNVKTVDMLMLRDSPDPKVIQSQWSVLEEALTTGQTRSIGVINFCESALKAVLQTAKITPAINYYMLHPGMGPDPRGVRSFGEARGIRSFAYGAMGEPGPNPDLAKSSILQDIAANHKVSPEEVAVRWILQTDASVSVRPTLDYGLGTSLCGASNTKCDDGLQARSSIFAWKLTKKEMKQLNGMTSPNDNPTLFSSNGCPDAFVL